MTIVEIKNLKRIFKTGNQKVSALNGIDLDINEGEHLVVERQPFCI